MGFLNRFLGRGDKAKGPAEPAGNQQTEKPLGLQILFAGGLPMDFDAVEATIRSYHPSMANARCELNLAGESNFFGVAEWGKHVVRLVGFGAPMPAAAVEACVAPAHFVDMALKARARAHSSVALLYYIGRDATAHEQYVALAAVAGALAQFDAIVVLNEAARTAVGANYLSAAQREGDSLQVLEGLPLLFLFCGLVKYNVEGREGVWMRTYGAAQFGLPDLAALAAGHHEGSRYFDMFEAIFGYLRDTGSTLSPGHTAQVGKDHYVRVRKATGEEDFLESEDELLVVESVGSG